MFSKLVQPQIYMKRVEERIGALRRRQEAPIRKQRIPQETPHPSCVSSLASRYQQTEHGRLFEIVRLRGGLGGFQLAVNFDPQIITLFRNLLNLNFQVPHATSNLAKDAKRVHPHAVSLMETVRTYGQTLDLVESNLGIEWLVAKYRNESQRLINVD